MIKRILPYFKPRWLRLVTAVTCMAAVAAISTALMWLLKFVVDNALVSRDWAALRIGVVVIISGFALKSILWYSHTYLTAYVAQSIARDLRDTVYRHLHALSMGFFHERSSGGILARLTNDVTTLQFSLTSAPTIIIRDGLSILGLVGFVLYLNWKFSLLCFAIVPPAVVVLIHLGKKSRRAGRDSQKKMGEIYTTIQESITSMPIVKTFQNEKKEIREFTEKNLDYFNALMRLARVEARSSPLMETLGSLALAGMLFYGGTDVITGVWSVGAFVAFMGAIMSLFNPIKKFAKVNVQIQQGLAAAERIFQLLDEKVTVSDSPEAVEINDFKDKIEFRNLNFSYSQASPVLQNVGLVVRKGEKLALVGPSGSGKTTLAQMLLRFYDPSAGDIVLDGRSLRNIKIASLRRLLAIVTQETYLFNDTVFGNIAYGQLGAQQKDVESAAKAAYAHEFITRLPNGYLTKIGEKGVRLSGGERQRLAIARALIKNPQILILDEATSSLDVESEKIVQKALDHLSLGRTVLLIAHRLSTIKNADRIVVVENGNIKEMGSHDELIKQKGSYRKLCELQAIG